jgi:DNA invertase Pin-like site-specific DNA recombinase
MKYSAGLYMRLSKDDGKKESMGIESQRLLLRRYAREREFEIFEEYIDDGYSGTNYERPAFQRLQEDIERGRINLVITKDLSRLGRNYIASGLLTEEYFPMHSVRFIAINDGYDSATGGDDMAPFRHVVNEMYARDISRKIRSALYAKMRDGQYIGSFAPYGYRKDPDCKNLLVPEESGACVVRWIFSAKRKNFSPSFIAEILNYMAVPIPLDHRLILEGKEPKNRKWRASGICKILKQPAYFGNIVQGKTRKPNFRSSYALPQPKENWIVSKNTHKPLIED